MFQRVIVAVLIAALVGCTNAKIIKPVTPSGAARHLEAGDEIVVQTNSGLSIPLTVVQVRQDAIVGEEQTILFSDIRSIKFKRFSAGKTLGAIGVVVLVAYLAVWIVIAEAFEGDE